jgi:hypothetical protein
MGQLNPAPVGGAKKITGPSTVALEHGSVMDDYDESSIIFNGGFPVCSFPVYYHEIPGLAI